MEIKKIKRFLPIIGLLIFVYLILKLGISKIFDEIRNANPIFLIIALFLIFILFVTQTLKWFVIARVQKTNIPFFEAFKINLIGLFYSFITPSKIGEAIRINYLKKYNDNKLGKGVSNFVLDKILDLCSIIFLAIISFLIFKSALSINYIYYLIFMSIFLIIFLFILIDIKKSKTIAKVFYKRLIPDKIKEKMKKGFYSFYENMPKKKYFILFFLLNLINWTIIYSIAFFIGRSVGINLPYFYFLAILPIGTLIGQIPITINGLGTREAVIIGLFGLLGVGATKVFSMSMINLFMTSVIPGIIGILISFKKRE